MCGIQKEPSKRVQDCSLVQEREPATDRSSGFGRDECSHPRRGCWKKNASSTLFEGANAIFTSLPRAAVGRRLPPLHWATILNPLRGFVLGVLRGTEFSKIGEKYGLIPILFSHVATSEHAKLHPFTFQKVVLGSMST